MFIKDLKKKGNRVSIIFDDDSRLLIHYNVFVDYGIRKGDEFDEIKLEKLNESNQFLLIKESALRILASRLNSSHELKRKLIQKKYSGELIEKVILDLIQFDYLNDEKFAEAYSNELVNRKKYGLARVKIELIKKGIDKKVIINVLNNFYKDNDLILSNALSYAKKKIEIIKRKEKDIIKIKQKLYSALLSKGYESQIIIEIIDILINKNNDENFY